LEQLRVLRLDDNRVRLIDVAAFSCTPLLSELDLGDNRLTGLTAGTLSPLAQLHRLSLDGNRFKVGQLKANAIMRLRFDGRYRLFIKGR